MTDRGNVSQMNGILRKFSRNLKSVFGITAEKPVIAILMVHGGKKPQAGRWLQLSLRRIRRHTLRNDCVIYLWNNNPNDPDIARLRTAPLPIRLVQADFGETLAHFHAVPLQRLYERARDDGAKYIVTMDTDAFPVRDGWLGELISHIDGGAVLAGVWRDELKRSIKPYIHPSCLCTSVEFIESSGLRLDTHDIKGEHKMDTLAALTYLAIEQGRRIHGLKRSNQNQLHVLMGGIYGDLVYHHGAGSRKRFSFWGEPRTDEQFEKNARIQSVLNELVFTHNHEFVRWLRGESQLPPEDPFMQSLLSGRKSLEENFPA